MEFGKSDWNNFEHGIKKEWLLSNGTGGFSSSTIIGANTRRYHGLLIASLHPPVRRHLIISKIDESIIINNRSYNLSSFKTPDFTMQGYLHLQRVVVHPLPMFVYSIEDVFLEKKITMVYGENTVCIVYHVINGKERIKLRLSPLVNFRDYHHTSRKVDGRFISSPCTRGVAVKSNDMDFDIKIVCSDGFFEESKNCWFMNMYYPVEQERGLDTIEDHYIPGWFDVEVNPHEDRYITVIASIENEIKTIDGTSLINQEEKRIESLIEKAGYRDEFASRLVEAADKFIVYRKSTDSITLIAGYPWFTDWGRDTMIAFTGLTLATRRFEDAKSIIYTFTRYLKGGLIPNMFPDEGQEPAYNTVDAALWFFEAVYKYLKYTGDEKFIRESVYPALKNIVNSYIRGTLFKIVMDKDYLITAGDAETQLTWMDAKVGSWVVTPRHGKAVEINALWYNALKIMSILAGNFGEDYNYYEDLAERVKDSFAREFWNGEKQCLFDVLTSDFKDDRVRPNQILAVSLSFSAVDMEMARKIVQTVWSELYTAYGLRTLTSASSDYRGIYKGDQYSRDGAYHQGTVWAWPLGHFITAFLKAYGYTDENRKRALMFINPFRDHLRDAGVGSISEIFDGNEPLTPRGCFAQAWSVGEILRSYTEDILVID